MKKCIYCGKEHPNDAIVCSIDQQPLVSDNPSIDSVTEAEPSPALAAPIAAPVPWMPPARSALGRILGSRTTWLAILGVAWALVLFRVVPSPSTSFYGKPPVDHYDFFAIFFPVIGPLAICPVGAMNLPLPLTLGFCALWIALFWGGFFWFMTKLKVLREPALLGLSLFYLVLIGVMLVVCAIRNRTPGIFDL